MAASKKPAAKAKQKMPKGKPRKAPTAATMTTKHRLWVAEMVRTGDLTKAAAAAGISYAQSKMLHSNVRYAHVQEALAKALAAVDEAAKAQAVWTREKLINKFAEIVDLALALVPNDEGFLKPNLRAGCTALAEIGKLSGFYTVKLEHKGKLTIADLVASVSEEDLAGG